MMLYLLWIGILYGIHTLMFVDRTSQIVQFKSCVLINLFHWSISPTISFSNAQIYVSLEQSKLLDPWTLECKIRRESRSMFYICCQSHIATLVKLIKFSLHSPTTAMIHPTLLLKCGNFITLFVSCYNWFSTTSHTITHCSLLRKFMVVGIII